MENNDFDIKLERTNELVIVTFKIKILKKMIIFFLFCISLVIILIDIFNLNIIYHLNSLFFIILGSFFSYYLIENLK